MATARCLFVVSDTVLIEGRGLVLLPGIKPEGDERFRLDDVVELRRPDKSTIRVKISGIEMLNPTPPNGGFAIILKDLVRKEDAPIATEVWSIPNILDYSAKGVTRSPLRENPALVLLLCCAFPIEIVVSLCGAIINLYSPSIWWILLTRIKVFAGLQFYCGLASAVISIGLYWRRTFQPKPWYLTLNLVINFSIVICAIIWFIANL